MVRKMTLVAAMVATLMLSGSAAFAGEITGTGESTPIRDGVAGSICAFSGLDDADDDGFGRTQSYGQLVRQGEVPPRFFNPGDTCNPNAGGGE